MSASPSPVRIGIYGFDEVQTTEPRGCSLWPPGYAAAVTAAGGNPVGLGYPNPTHGWDEILEGLDGVLFLGSQGGTARQAAHEERLCTYCRKHQVPVLAIDYGLHTLNTTFGGSLHLDLGREVPQALQHRHPPERGLRHAITVEPNTRLADIYGEGEIVVNSEHLRGVNRVARGFRVSARALDTVIEAIEAESKDWFAIGVQWQPASPSASGLDIQVFRGLVEASQARLHQSTAAVHSPAA